MRWLALALLASAAPVASANGRPPRTNGVYFRPGDAHSIFVRSTFGLLVSRDDGCSFRWVCEKAIGYGGEFDPKYAVAADGTIFATTFEGLRLSRDGGCSWETATAGAKPGDPGNISDIWIDALDISPTGEIWVATAESAKPNDVYSSTDNGVTFRPRGLHSPTIWWKSVKVAKANPMRIYLAGYQVSGRKPGAHLMRSNDGGITWAELALAPMKFGATPIVLVAAVDPKQPDTLLVTSLGSNGKGDQLYRSTTGGYAFTEVLVSEDTLRDVVFAADGSVYAAALTGTYRSTDNGATFQVLAGSPQLDCINQRSDGSLVGCGANWDRDFKAAVATTTPGDPTAWSKLFRFVDLAGPLTCAAGTTAQRLCAPSWPSLQQQFGSTGQTASCPVVAEPAPSPPAPAPAPAQAPGCCDAGRSNQLGALALAGWIAWLRRRRR
ncbi:MAG: sialidase family protein [Kofleriaceae bacterium]